MEQVFLFDVVSQLYIATDRTPVDIGRFSICAEMIDVFLDISFIYNPPNSYSMTDSKSSSIIKLSNGDILLLRELERCLALICIFKEDSYERSTFVDFNIDIFKQGVILLINSREKKQRIIFGIRGLRLMERGKIRIQQETIDSIDQSQIVIQNDLKNDNTILNNSMVSNTMNFSDIQETTILTKSPQKLSWVCNTDRSYSKLQRSQVRNSNQLTYSSTPLDFNLMITELNTQDEIPQGQSLMNQYFGSQSSGIELLPRLQINQEQKKTPQIKRKKDIYEEEDLNIDHFQQDAIDNPNKTRIGFHVPVSFGSYNKRIDRIKEQNHFFKIRQSVYTQLIAKAGEQNTVPRKLGIVQSSGKPEQFKLRQFSLGDDLAEVFSQGLASDSLRDLHQRIDLTRNRLTDRGIVTVTQNISQKAASLILDSNQIGQLSVLSLSSILEDPYYELSELSLKNNQIEDQLAHLLFRNLRKLKQLNISENSLTDASAPLVAEYLATDVDLKEFYISSNKLSSVGGNLVVTALTNNSTINVFDISQNNIGMGVQYEQLTQSLVNLFSSQVSQLKHVDISQNGFQENQFEVILESVNQNKKIYGFHFSSEKHVMNSRGFIVPNQNSEQKSQLHFNNRWSMDQIDQIKVDVQSRKGIRIQQDLGRNHPKQQLAPTSVLGTNISISGLQPNHSSLDLIKTISKAQFSSQYLKCCWICEGWFQYDFSWTPGVSGPCQEDPIHLHLQSDQYNPSLMERDPNDGIFKVKRMIPPIRNLKYFFSTGMGDSHAQDQPFVKNGFPIIQKIRYKETLETQFVLQLNYLNLDEEIKQKRKIFNYSDQQLQTLISCVPRDPIQYYKFQKHKQFRKSWELKNSVFAPYQGDSAAVLLECLETDWQYSKITQIVQEKEDKFNLFQAFKEYYPIVKNAYRYYASYYPIGEIWAIPSILIGEILTKMDGVIDGQILKLSDVDLQFISCKSNSQKLGALCPQRGMVRFQFLELIVRLAEEKYVQTQATETYTAAVVKLLENGYLKFLLEIDQSQKWRDSYLWKQECDNVYQFYLPILQSIYDLYCGTIRDTLPQYKFLNVAEWRSIFQNISFGDKNNATNSATTASSNNNNANSGGGQRELLLSYNRALMSVKDEITSEKVLEMTFVEFIEAIARVSEFIFPKTQNDMALCRQIENTIILMYQNALDQPRKDQFQIPNFSVCDFYDEEDDFVVLDFSVVQKDQKPLIIQFNGQDQKDD